MNELPPWFERRLIVAMLLCSWLAAGCGKSDGRLALSGTVTFDGQPVDGGSIAFLPEGEGTADKPKLGARIEEGKYAIPAAKGALPGTYRIDIRWPKKTGKKIPFDDPPSMIDETKQAIRAKYNVNSILTRDVLAGATNFDFDLSK
jgi:hypothetical protein